jgi:hypothetical protein
MPAPALVAKKLIWFCCCCATALLAPNSTRAIAVTRQ